MKPNALTALLNKVILTQTVLTGNACQRDMFHVKKWRSLPCPLSARRPAFCFSKSASKQNAFRAPQYSHLPTALPSTATRPRA